MHLLTHIVSIIAISRSRLVVISPFPQCQHYWDEYANDTFNYLLEIEVCFLFSDSPNVLPSDSHVFMFGLFGLLTHHIFIPI